MADESTQGTEASLLPPPVAQRDNPFPCLQCGHHHNSGKSYCDKEKESGPEKGLLCCCSVLQKASEPPAPAPPPPDTGAAVVAAMEAHVKALALKPLASPRVRRELRRSLHELDRIRQVVCSPAQEQKEMGRARRGGFMGGIGLGPGYDAPMMNDDVDQDVNAEDMLVEGPGNFGQPIREQEPNEPETFNDRLLRELGALIPILVEKAKRDGLAASVGQDLRRMELVKDVLAQRRAAVNAGDETGERAAEELLAKLDWHEVGAKKVEVLPPLEDEPRAPMAESHDPDAGGPPGT